MPSTEQIQKQLIELNKAKKELGTISSSLQDLLEKTDQISQQQIDSWHAHREKYFDTLTEQLKSSGFVLTDVEKFELRRVVSTPAITRAALAALEKLKVEMPKEPSDFEVATYTAIMDKKAELARAEKTQI